MRALGDSRKPVVRTCCPHLHSKGRCTEVSALWCCNFRHESVWITRWLAPGYISTYQYTLPLGHRWDTVVRATDSRRYWDTVGVGSDMNITSNTYLVNLSPAADDSRAQQIGEEQLVLLQQAAANILLVTDQRHAPDMMCAPRGSCCCTRDASERRKRAEAPDDTI